MAKAKGAFLRACRPDEVRADKSKVTGHLVAHLLADQRLHRLACELLALDGCRLDHHALAVPQTVEACGEQRMDHRGYGDGHRRVGRVEMPALVSQHGHDLFDIERIALGNVEDAHRGVVPEPPPQQVAQQVPGLDSPRASQQH